MGCFILKLSQDKRTLSLTISLKNETKNDIQLDINMETFE